MSEKFKTEEEDERTIPPQSFGEGECPVNIQVSEPRSGWVAAGVAIVVVAQLKDNTINDN